MLTQHYHKVNRGVIVCVTKSRKKRGFCLSRRRTTSIPEGNAFRSCKKKEKNENICKLSLILYDRNSQDIWKTSYLAYLSVKDNYVSLEGVFFFMIWTPTLHDKQN